jgi:hypothetical protein
VTHQLSLAVVVVSLPLAFFTAGFDVLTAMEKVATDEDDRPVQVGGCEGMCGGVGACTACLHLYRRGSPSLGPACSFAMHCPRCTATCTACTCTVLQEIRITGATVFVNPYKELLEEQAAAEAAKRKQVGVAGWGAWLGGPAGWQRRPAGRWRWGWSWCADAGWVLNAPSRSRQSCIIDHTHCQDSHLVPPKLHFPPPQAEKEEQGYANDDVFGSWWSNPAAAKGAAGTAAGPAGAAGGEGGAPGVGRYLSAAPAAGAGAAAAAPAAAAEAAAAQPAAKKAKSAAGYGNFDAW